MSGLYNLRYAPGREGKHWNVLNALLERKRAGEEHMQKRRSKFEDIEKLVRAYIPETEADRIRKEKYKVGGEPRYYSVQVPYGYAELMTAHTYVVLTLLSRYPVFQYYGRNSRGQDNEINAESMMEYQLRAGDNLVPLYIWLYDAMKYGIGIL